MTTVKEIAKMIDHSLLQPVMTDEMLKAGIELAIKYDVASVCIKPYALEMAVEMLKGTTINPGTTVGFPHGSNTIECKIFETLEALKKGAKEIDMCVNTGKVLSQDWAYVKRELAEVTKACHDHGATIKIIFETDYITDDALKIRLCEICTEVGCDWVKTSTGFSYIKMPDDRFDYVGATEHNIALFRKHSGPKVQVKPSGKVRSLDDVLKYKALGATRIGVRLTAEVLEEAKKRFGG
ncbi:MAG: deoxyribose-phosphate aldolase [Bacteroidota bacterium]|nr:deoxyribose-phosphate aldolase [Bacteroidota bacterium]